MNSLMEAWCDRPGHQIVLTRSRAYKSNDQAWVEQKTGMVVGLLVGNQTSRQQSGLHPHRPVAGCRLLSGGAFSLHS